MKPSPFYFFAILLMTFSFQHILCQDTVKIMPLGNSITEGWTDGTLLENQRKGYRMDLKQLLNSSGYIIDFVGSETSGDAYFTDAQHAGIGGSRDQYVARLLLDGYDEKWGEQIIDPPGPYLDEYNPDIILLHIGTNDITHEHDLAITNEQVSLILDLIDQYEVRSGRKVIVFLALIISRKDYYPGYYMTSLFNNYIEDMALSRIASGDDIVIVDMEHDAGFLYTDTDMADDLHPNALGYLKMANLWHTKIMDNYNTAPVISPIPDQILPEGGTSGAVSLDEYVTDIQDPDQDINWSAEQLNATHLDITIDANRDVTVTPLDDDWNGTQTVIFTATDNGKNGKYVKSDKDTVVFTVYPVNDAPVFLSDPVVWVEKDALYTYMFSAVDPDPGDILEFSLIDPPDWLELYEASDLLVGVSEHAGDYPVILRVSDGTTHTDQPFSIHVDGATPVIENTAEDPAVIYPNPASDYFKIFLSDCSSGSIHIRLYDSNGKSVMNRFINDPQTEIYISLNRYIAPGIYFYKIILEKEIYTGKLLIER